MIANIYGRQEDRDKPFVGWLAVFGVWAIYLTLINPFELSGFDIANMNAFERLFIHTYGMHPTILLPFFVTCFFIAWLSSNSIVPVAGCILFALLVLLNAGFGVIAGFACVLALVACISYSVGFVRGW